MSDSAEESIAASFLRSALTSESDAFSNSQFRSWFEARLAAGRFSVRQIPLSDLDGWHWEGNPRRLSHVTGRFFSVEGLRVEIRGDRNESWEQPIINQPEIGILGILTRRERGVRTFLMQAKMEPGNFNLLQLSPTLQATHSNYTRAHGGATPRYLEYFTDPKAHRVLVDQLQSEQGARFLRKRNRNMVVEVSEEIPVHDDFCWLTLGQIKQLLQTENLVNMDARSVLSCIPFELPDRGFGAGEFAGGEPPVKPGGFAAALLESLSLDAGSHTSQQLSDWLVSRKQHYSVALEQRPLDAISDWISGDENIRHRAGDYFSVIGVAVEAGSREVVRWSQPILDHPGIGVVGLITQRQGGALHCLVRATVEPGNRDTVDVGPTVACTRPESRLANPNPPAFLDCFVHPKADHIRYSTVQSEEGGRFHHFQNRYMILEIPEAASLPVSEDFIWVTLGQAANWGARGVLNIELRNLLACLSFTAP